MPVTLAVRELVSHANAQDPDTRLAGCATAPPLNAVSVDGGLPCFDPNSCSQGVEFSGWCGAKGLSAANASGCQPDAPVDLVK